MSGAPGYVHISQRTRGAGLRPVGGQRAPQGAPLNQRGPAREPSQYTSLRTMQQAEQPAPAPESAENEARGFVLYVGLNEDLAAQNGTTLVQMVQDIRAYAHTLVPQAESSAAVAIAPAGAEGTDLAVVRDALGDPTAPRHQQATQTRAHAPAQDAAKPAHSAGVLIDLSRREVFLDGELLNLTYKEFELLNYLVENASRTVGREELLESLWRDAEDVPSERTIDVHIRRLRSKLSRLSNTVRTVRGQGYRFYEHPEVVVWAAPEYSI